MNKPTEANNNKHEQRDDLISVIVPCYNEENVPVSYTHLTLPTTSRV